MAPLDHGERLAIVEEKCREHERKITGLMAQVLVLQSNLDEAHGAAREGARLGAFWLGLAGLMLTVLNVGMSLAVAVFHVGVR